MSKKTETIEFRLSPELKAQLSELCKSRGQAMSGLIRQLVQDEISDFAQDSTQSGMKMMAKTGTRRLREFGLAGVALVALALAWNLATKTPVAAQAEVRITFAEMDRNDDGIVTREEFRRFAEEAYAADVEEEEADILEALELPKACEADFAAAEDEDEGEDQVVLLALAGDFTAYDANQDGRLVFEELREAFAFERAQEFARIDGDGDGFLTRKEFGEGMSTLVSEEGEEGEVSAECLQALAAQESPPFDSNELRLAFVAFDENRDNQISEEEYLNN